MRASLERGPRLSDVLVTVALLAWPALVMRAILLATTTPALRLADLRGCLSDLGVAVLFATLTLLRPLALRRASIALSFVVSAVVSVINFEHVRANGSSFDVAGAYLLADGTFFRGSILGASTIAQFAIVFIPPILGTLFYARRGRRSARRVRAVDLALGVVLFACFELTVPVPNDRVHWRQQHPLVENAARMWQRGAGGQQPGRNASHGVLPTAYQHLHVRDLNGEQVLDERRPIKNVLLVMIEGLSRGHIFNMRDEQRGPGWLGNLAEFAKKHVDFTQYFALQRQTVRGEYTVLCGALPNLVAPALEMDVYSATPRSERAECLPQFLERNGMKTVYLQAAPITFMGKGEFLPNAGFSSVLDTKWFSKAYSASGWGVDDRAFFEQAGELILKLRGGDKPWFLSLLTVGTHHPYLVPPEWKGRSGAGRFEDALLYLDTVLKNFFAQLESEHVLDDTLLIITGDESAGYMLPNETAEMMSQHSTPLILAYPGERPGRVDERFTHSDLALSISDALGMAESSKFFGRSAFRRYAGGRRLVFGNSYLAKVGAIGPDDELLLCERGLGACSGFRLGKQDLFLTDLAPREVGQDEAASLKEVVQVVDRDLPSATSGPTKLFTPKAVRLKRRDDEQLIFFGKYLEVERPSRVSVHLALGTKGGATILHHDIFSGGGTPLFGSQKLLLLPGTNLDWTYDLELHAPVEQLEFRLGAFNRAATDAVIDMRAAEVQFIEHPASDKPTAGQPEIGPKSFKVTRSDDVSLNMLEYGDILSRADCVKDAGQGTLRLDDCADGVAISGPHVPLPAEVTVQVHFTLKVAAGHAMARVAVTAEDGSSELGSSAPLPLVAGQTYELATQVRLTRSHADVETRIVLEGASGLSASLIAARLDVSGS